MKTFRAKSDLLITPKNIIVSLKKVVSIKKSDAVLILNNRNVIIYCTNAVSKILNKKSSELLNSKCPFKITGEIKLLSKGNKEITYKINSVAVEWRKGTFRFVFLNRIKTQQVSKGVPKRFHSEKILHNTIRDLESIIWSLPDIYFRMDKDGTILDYKAGRSTDLYVAPEIFLGKKMQSVLPPSVGSQFSTAIKEISKSKRYVQIEYELPLTGGEKSFEARILPFKNNQVIALIRDITERKHMEDSLRRERILLRTVIDNLPDGIYAKDINCRKTLANRCDLEHMGCEKEEDAFGKDDFDFFSQEIASAFFADDQIVIQSGQPVINREEFFIDKNGSKCWLLTSKIPLYDENKKIIGLIGISHDITNRKHAEDALLQAKKKYHSIFENSVEGIVQSTSEGTLLNANPAIAKMFGYDSPEEFINSIIDIGNQIYVDPKQRIEFKKIMELQGEVRGFEAQVYRKNGEKIWISENGCAVKDDEGNIIHYESYVSNITLRREADEKIKKMNEELRELNATKDKFFSIIAHDLKNPYITILGFTDLLLSDYGDLSDDQRIFYLQEMKKSTDLSYSLLQNLLCWSQSQTGRIEFNPQKLNLFQIVDENLVLLNKYAEKKQIRMLHQVSPELQIFADKDMINTVLRNLLTNAIKFSNKMGSICVNANAKDNFVEICIMDDGVGMDRATIDSLFRLDVTHSKSGTENETGTGLGLILCKEFIEKNNGSIHVDSEVGKGSKFFFTLPLAGL